MRLLLSLFFISLFVLSSTLIPQQTETKVSKKRIKEMRDFFDLNSPTKYKWEKYDLVFEGTIVESTIFTKEFSFWTETVGVYKIKIHKIFKGDPTIEFIETTVVLTGNNPHMITLRMGQSGIFTGIVSDKSFLNQLEYKNQYVKEHDDIYGAHPLFRYKLDDYYKRRSNEEFINTGEACCPLINKRLNDKFFTIDNTELMYAFLESYEELKMVKIDNIEFEFKDKEFYKTNHQKRKKNLKRWNKWLDRQYKKQQ